MITEWNQDMNRKAAVTIRVRQAAPGVWEPDEQGDFEIFASMLPMLTGPDQEAVAAGITASLAADARREAIAAQVRLTREAYIASLAGEDEPDLPEYVVLDQDGRRVCVAGMADGSARCGCDDCTVLPAGVTGPALSPGYGLHPMTRTVLAAQREFEAGLASKKARAAFEASRGRPAIVLPSGARYTPRGPVLRDCGTGGPFTATVDERPPPQDEKHLAPEPPDPAEEIRLSLLEPLHMDQAELDRLVPYGKAPAGLCQNCHLGAVLPGGTLCYYCNLVRELSGQEKAKATAQAAGNLIAGVQAARAEGRPRTPGTRPGPDIVRKRDRLGRLTEITYWSCTCKCPSRKAHEIRIGTRPGFARGVAVIAALIMLYAAAHGFPFLFPFAVAFIILARTYGRRGPR